MASGTGFDTRFSLPAVDDPPLTEAGIILMGLDPDRLLAGLGLATADDDPGQVALAVDRCRHGVGAHPPMDALVAAGGRRWRQATAALDAAGLLPSRSASLRQAWEHTLRLLAAVDLGGAGPATYAYLAACWLRRDAVDSLVAGRPTN
jgi:hypothetical protein